MDELLNTRKKMWELCGRLVKDGDDEKAAEVLRQLIGLETKLFNLLYGKGHGLKMSVVSALMEIHLDTVKRAGSYCEELVKMVKGHLVIVLNEGRQEL